MIRIALLLAAVALFLPATCPAQTPAKMRIVLLVVPGLRADDLKDPDLFYIRFAISQGAVGWMNTRTARIPGQSKDSDAAAYLTLGTGARATAGSLGRSYRDGWLSRLIVDNARLDHLVNVGLLGEMIRRAGLSTIVEGGDDDPGSPSGGLLTAMDRHGRIDVDRTPAKYWEQRSDTDNILVDAPYGIRQKIDSHPMFYDDPAGLSVHVLGDLARADRYARNCLPPVAAAMRKRALLTIDAQIGRRAAVADMSWDYPMFRGTRFVLLSACGADSATDGDRLAPIAMWGDGVTPGLLTSGSTHTEGLVTNTDFVPTVAQFFGLTPPKGLVGRPMTVVPARLAPTSDSWASMHDRWYAQSRKQALFGGLPTIQFFIVLACLILANRRNSTAATGALLVSVSSLPLTLLVLPPISPASVVASGAILGAALLGVAVIAWIRPRAASMLATIMLGALVAAVTVDLLIGCRLLREAWMSYSVMEGARYYGIGNEYVGAIFGAMMALSLVLLRGEAIRRWTPAAALCLLVCALIGLPPFGANAGGFLGAAMGCGTAALVWWRGGIRARDVVVLLAGAVLLMGTFIAFDLARSDAEQSHFARALGGGSVLNIVVRKAALNAYLLLHSPWTLGLLASAYGLWRLRRQGSLAHIETDRSVRGMRAGLAVGSISLMLLNDSGVVAAAECLLVGYAAMSLQLVVPATLPMEERT